MVEMEPAARTEKECFEMLLRAIDGPKAQFKPSLGNARDFCRPGKLAPWQVALPTARSMGDDTFYLRKF